MNNAQRNKRRASGRQEDEPAKKKGRPSKADLTSQVPSDAIHRVKARRMLEKYSPLRDTGDDLDGYYRELVSWHVDAQWGPEDDDAIAVEWDQSPQKANSLVFKPAQHGSLLTLFKVCLRLYKTTPITILSPYHSLRYHPVSPNGMGNKWVYSKSFCDELTALIVHPFWESDADLFATALQWTVICRLDDRRLWSGRLNKPCTALDSVYEEVQRCYEHNEALSCSYHEMHASERELILERGESPGEWSDLFYRIGELASKVTAAKPDDEFLRLLGLPVLPVTISDLRLLNEALSSTELRPEWNYTVEEALQGWNAEVSGQELPGMKKLPLVFEIAWKSVLRYVRLVKRINGSESSSPFSDDEDDQGPPVSVHTHVSEDNESEPKTIPRSRKLRRRQVADEESDGEDEFIPHFSPRSHYEGNGEDDGMGGNLEGNLGLDQPPEDPAQSTSGLDVLPAHGATLSSRTSLGRPAPSVYPSFHEMQMASDISALKKTNTELYKLLRDGQREQKELMLNMQKQLESMQSELSELRQAKEAPNRGDNVQRPPEVTVTSDSAPKSPELGTIRSALHNDVVSLEEATVVEPMDEDIPPEQAVPKEKTLEPEASEQQVTIASEALQSDPEHGTPKRKTPEPETSEQPVTTVQEQAPQPVSTDTNPSQEGEGRTQVVSQLHGVIAETSTSMEKASDQSPALPPWPVLPPNPPMPRRNIPRLACAGAGRFPATSDAHDVFVTPRSEVLKILKGYN
ncbi:hypothetical protein FOBRF1_011926 [Fusarium oxysporum]